MESINDFFAGFSSFIWGWPMLILLLGTHLYLTTLLRFPQRKLLTGIRLSLKKDEAISGDVSQFGALVTSLAATIGTGNIIGVATAVSLGGPGAVFWCWLTGILGIATKYGEGLLAIKYRVRTSRGEMLGGPMYAMERGLNMKWLALLFCLFTAVASFGIGNTMQSNSISTLLHETYTVPPSLSGLIVAGAAGLVILFGVKGIAKACTAIVPFMVLFYVLGCLTVLVLNAHYLGDSLLLIIEFVFTPQAAGGGFAGSTVLLAARYGIARGLFSNESGMGSAPIVAAAAKTRNPVRQALVSSTGTFWDTVVICTLTGLVLVSTILAHPEIDYTQGAVLTKVAFEKIPVIGPLVLTIGISTFAFSTLLGWSYYGERAVEYLGGKKGIRIFRILWIIAVYIGSVGNLTVVWNIADSMNALMALPNLLSLLFLSGILVKETRYYLWQNRLDEYDKSEIPSL